MTYVRDRIRLALLVVLVACAGCERKNTGGSEAEGDAVNPSQTEGGTEGSTVKLFQTVGFQFRHLGNPQEPDGPLAVRMESEESGRFLLARCLSNPTWDGFEPPTDPAQQAGGWPQRLYLYDPATETLDEVDGQHWFSATGDMVWGDCTYWANPDVKPLASAIAKDGKLKGPRKGQVIATRGQYAVNCAYNPTGDRMAVISGDGPATTAGSFLTFGSRTDYEGQHYLELLSLPDFKRIGEAIRIPFKSSEGLTCMTWSPDGRFVICRYYSKPDTCIIPVIEGKGEKP